MEIGGVDKTVDINPSRLHIRFILLAFHMVWPDGLIEFDDEEGGQATLSSVTGSIHAMDRLAPPSTSFFVYRDVHSQGTWAAAGATEENKEAMVWVRADDNGIHFTYGSHIGASGRIVSDIADGLILTRAH